MIKKLHLVGVELNLEQLTQGLNVSRGRLATVAGRGTALNSRKFNTSFQNDLTKTTSQRLWRSVSFWDLLDFCRLS